MSVAVQRGRRSPGKSEALKKSRSSRGEWAGCTTFQNPGGSGARPLEAFVDLVSSPVGPWSRGQHLRTGPKPSLNFEGLLEIQRSAVLMFPERIDFVWTGKATKRIFLLVSVAAYGAPKRSGTAPPPGQPRGSSGQHWGQSCPRLCPPCRSASVPRPSCPACVRELTRLALRYLEQGSTPSPPPLPGRAARQNGVCTLASWLPHQASKFSQGALASPE